MRAATTRARLSRANTHHGETDVDLTSRMRDSADSCPLAPTPIRKGSTAHRVYESAAALDTTKPIVARTYTSARYKFAPPRVKPGCSEYLVRSYVEHGSSATLERDAERHTRSARRRLLSFGMPSPHIVSRARAPLERRTRHPGTGQPGSAFASGSRVRISLPSALVELCGSPRAAIDARLSPAARMPVSRALDTATAQIDISNFTKAPEAARMNKRLWFFL